MFNYSILYNLYEVIVESKHATPSASPPVTGGESRRDDKDGANSARLCRALAQIAQQARMIIDDADIV